MMTYLLPSTSADILTEFSTKELEAGKDISAEPQLSYIWRQLGFCRGAYRSRAIRIIPINAPPKKDIAPAPFSFNKLEAAMRAS